MSDAARSEVLGRVRSALVDVRGDEPSVAIGAMGAPAEPSRARDELVQLFAECVEDYRATVTRSPRVLLSETIAALCERQGARRIAVPLGRAAEWMPREIEAIVDDPPLDVKALDTVDGVLTGALVGIAETGTIVLDGGALSGRRALSLVPDLHICILHVEDLVGTVPEGVRAMASAIADGRPITLISGPSATSDIELERVEGVHGPRRLEVVLVG